ncbi:MAG: exported protein of unknown function [Candidatus Saccharibacteria bacterium]|nr:exported protein of unknown function [Candidatus Saccharibacteria bacterium]
MQLIKQRGDTLIEVLFAFSILSLVIVGAMTIMNQGSIASQRALETTLVREQIDAQSTTLRFLHDAYVAKFQPGISYATNTPAGQWTTMASNLNATTASPFGTITTCPTPPAGSFILNPATGEYVTAGSKLKPSVTFSQLTFDAQTGQVLQEAQGIWIEGIRSQAIGNNNQTNTRFIDFHIRACWENPGQGPPMTIGTIVRLYEPRG